MEIKHDHLRNAIRAWAAEVGQRRIAELITTTYHQHRMTSPCLGIIECADGSINFDVWHNNKQQIFRWLDGETDRAKQNIKDLLPAILDAMPASLRAQIVAGNSIEYLATRALKEHQDAITAALLHAPLAVFDRECDEAEREFARFRQVARTHLH